MHPLILRIIIFISAGLLMFEIIKGQYTVRLETANFIDFIIIILAISGLILGIGIPETLSDDSASPGAVSSIADIAPSQRDQTDEESKSEEN